MHRPLLGACLNQLAEGGKVGGPQRDRARLLKAVCSVLFVIAVIIVTVVIIVVVFLPLAFSLALAPALPSRGVGLEPAGDGDRLCTSPRGGGRPRVLQLVIGAILTLQTPDLGPRVAGQKY